jgi:hypothetical protein
MAKSDRISTGRYCTIDGLTGVYRVKYWITKDGVVWVEGEDEQGKLLCSLDPSGTLGVARKDVHLIPLEEETLWT